MPDFTILPLGADIRIGDDIPAIVMATTIRGERVSYQVAWWDDRKRVESWVEACEITALDSTEELKIGFQT